MARRKPTWKCQRSSDGEKCGHINPSRKRNCEACSKPRPARTTPAHESVLALPYSYFVEANGGIDACGICGALPSATRSLDRDHSHEGVGFARGVLCWKHNRALEMFGDDPILLQAAIDYLARAEARRPR